jgi:hypothetical protein
MRGAGQLLLAVAVVSDSEARYAGRWAIFLSINQGFRLMTAYHDMLDDDSGIGCEPRGGFRCDVMMRDTLLLPSFYKAKDQFSLKLLLSSLHCQAPDM